MTGTILAATALLLLSARPGSADDSATSKGRREAQTALKPFAGLVGEWKGTGQPQRGSARGAWVESGGWSWKLSPDAAALELKLSKGKLLKSARLRPGKNPDEFVLDAELADGSKREFAGKRNGTKPLVLLANPPVGDGPRRLTLSPLHDTRFLFLIETRASGDSNYTRLAEVGYTRQGVAFAAGASYPLCIVTEGRGTTQVAYQGKTYWVCCSGCKDLFNENPAAILAEAADRAKAKDKK